MTLSRRHFLAAIPATLFARPATALASSEPFPVFASDAKRVAYKFRRREVDYKTKEPPGTIIVDSRKRYLYYVLGKGRAIRYGVGVGRKEAVWSGEAVIGRKARWPTWTPTREQLARSERYEKFAGGYPGGPLNPLGARALYLYDDGKDTLYRIHGTPEPRSIGTYSSSGCIRMINVDVIDLFNRADVGTRVVVLD